jgi:hypothetical protein
MGHLAWAELGLFVLLSLLVALAALLALRRPRPAPGSWLDLPEMRLITLALPLHLLWEVAQFPLYTIWHQNDWSYILYGLAHCTLGDLLIVLLLYELVALLRQDRRWYLRSVVGSGALFTAGGVAYTVFSEIFNVRIKGTWGYTELMPMVAVANIGGTPFLQWLLIPPILLWLMRLLARQRGAPPNVPAKASIRGSI